MGRKRAEKVEIKCPLTRALNMLSGKWDLVICHLLAMNERPLRFNELKEKISQAFSDGKGICPSSLSQSLKRLEEYKIVERKVRTNEIPVAVEYRLTEKGKALKPILESLREWGEKWT